MPRTALAAQQIAAAGIVPAYAAANVDGHSFPNDGNTILHVKNGSAASINVTLQTPQQKSGLDVAENIVAIAAGSEKMIGRLTPETYNRPSGAVDPSTVYVDFSAVATVTVALLEP